MQILILFYFYQISNYFPYIKINAQQNLRTSLLGSIENCAKWQTSSKSASKLSENNRTILQGGKEIAMVTFDIEKR